MSSAFSAKSGDSRVSVQRSLGEGLNLPYDESVFCIYRDHRAGLEYIRNCRDLHDNGFYAELNAYQHIVLLDFRIVADTPLYRQLASYLGGRGVPSIDEALREIMVAPVRTPFRELVNGDLLTRLLDASEKPDEKVLTEAAQKLTVLLDAVEAFVGEAAAAPTANQKAAPTTAVRAREVRKQLEALLKLPKDNAPAPIRALVTGFSDEKLLWGSLIAWLFVRALGDAEQVRSWLDEWLLGRLIGEALREVDLEGHLAARGVTSVKLALALPEILTAQGDESPVKLIDALLQNTDAQLLLNINHFQGVVWFNQEGYDTLLRWMIFAAQLEAKPAELETRYATIQQLAQAAKGSGYQIEKLRAALAAPAAEGA
jgi:hypothetical protein